MLVKEFCSAIHICIYYSPSESPVLEPVVGESVGSTASGSVGVTVHLYQEEGMQL